jgi:hypothetical protein
MPGGNKNIRPEDGRQFSSTYQPKPKWTKAKAVQLGEDLIAWQNKDAINIFWEEFLVMERNLHPNVIGYLCKKFSSFSDLIGKARKIQELKLQKYGTADKLNAAITKFVLINKHGWREKQELTGADGKDLNTSIMIEFIDSADKVDKDESEKD